MWRSALAPLALLAIGSASPAWAAPGEAPEPPAAAVDPPSGKLSLELHSGIRDGSRVYVMKGQRVKLEVEVERPAAGEKVSVEVDGESHRLRGTPLPANAGGGPLTDSFTAKRLGARRVRVEREGGGSATTTVHVVSPRVRPGSRGLGVRLLQRGLSSLGYVTPSSGRYDRATGRAVMAYRKVARMGRRASAGEAVMKRLFRGRGGFRLRYPRAGKHVEFDFSRQVLVLARGSKVEGVYHASSGKPSTPTVFGTFRFYRKQPGTNSHGMVFSSYFVRGYAIHGFRSVPAHAASHGCIRVPIPNARSIYSWVSAGDRIFVYR